MPIYGYRCDGCGHELETFQNMADPPLTVCPQCQGRLRKQLYPVGVVFKGSGFYTTDYRGSGKSGNGSKGSSGEGGSEAKGEAKSEAKGEAKSEKSETKSDKPASSGSGSSSD